MNDYKISDAQQVCWDIRSIEQLRGGHKFRRMGSCPGSVVMGQYLDSLCQTCPYLDKNWHKLHAL